MSSTRGNATSADAVHGRMDGLSSSAEESREYRARLMVRRRVDVMNRWIWLCPVLSVAVAIGVFIALGLSVWTAVLAALVVGCPIAALWACFAGRVPTNRPAGTPRSS